MTASASLWDVMHFDTQNWSRPRRSTGLDPRADRRASFGRASSSAGPQGWRGCVGWLMAILLAAVGVPVSPAAAEPEPVRTTDVTFVGGGCDPARDRGGARTEREPSTSLSHAGGSREP